MRREASLPKLFEREIGAIHCVGVGGMGLGPLAIYLAQRGFRVSGEDDALTDAMRHLLEREKVTITTAGGVPADCQLVAYSSAIAKTHPAYLAATGRGIPLIRRGELLAEVTRDKKLVAVCGSHGKTTTTAMLITALRAANFPAGYVLGGLFNDDAISPARHGSNDWVVAEIDESDGTIAQFSPEITVAVNLDWDHPDHYRELADLEATFAALLKRTHAAVLLNDACPLSARVAARQGRAAQYTFGRTGDFRFRVENERGGKMELRLGGKFPEISAVVRAQGDFNASNATAALAAAQLMGAEISSSKLADYPGVRRRQSVLHATAGLTVIEDYAHHPSEIRALLGSLRRGASGRLLAVFQPHRFSRTAQFKGEFAASLAMADAVYLLDVYSAGEGHIAGGTTADLYAELKAKAPSLPVHYCPGNPAALLEQLHRDAGLWKPELVAFVGAGDIDQHARSWVKQLAQAQSTAARWDQLAETFRGLVSPATKVKREESLAEKTTMRVGGAARIYAEPATAADLQQLVRAAQRDRVTLHVIGRGSNLLVPDEGVDGLVLSFGHANWQTFEVRDDGKVWVGAGLRLKNLCGLATKAGLVGFEFLEGIPGNVGGALRMNAGAMGGWMFDVVEEVELMTLEGEILRLNKAVMHVDYRHCAELHDAFALGALLQPKAAARADEISRQIETYRDKRQKSQPREPSAGCIFKNPEGNSAGKLIDEAGLKGERVGDAEVSSVHANFIINRGHASSADVIELVRRVRARVEQAKGIRLEPEVLLYGKEWKDVI
ncbi:MAG TPA: UDP-N-acetylmuramate dehydrogenase [Opitutaceae bacterium]|nr:UDP-N-acetylmuramate dehydrogenase [Opitutaceae bacterium]